MKFYANFVQICTKGSGDAVFNVASNVAARARAIPGTEFQVVTKYTSLIAVSSESSQDSDLDSWPFTALETDAVDDIIYDKAAILKAELQ